MRADIVAVDGQRYEGSVEYVAATRIPNLHWLAREDGAYFGRCSEARSIFGLAARRGNLRGINDEEPQSLAAESHRVSIHDLQCTRRCDGGMWTGGGVRICRRLAKA